MSMHVLFVDDEADLRYIVGDALVDCGYQVTVARDAREAMEALRGGTRFSHIVSDISMPEVDGYELIRLIRRDRKSRIPAIALTAMARIEDRIKALTAGYQMHVSKPVQPVELITIVASLVLLVDRDPKPENS